jgi:hypothetical protein
MEKREGRNFSVLSPEAFVPDQMPKLFPIIFLPDENNTIPTTVPGPTSASASEAAAANLDQHQASTSSIVSASGGKLTTWSNIGKPTSSVRSGSGKEENNNNNNNGDNDEIASSRSRSRKSRSLDDMGGRERGVRMLKNPSPVNIAARNCDEEAEVASSPNTEARLVSAFIKNRERLEWEESGESALPCGADDHLSPGAGGAAGAIPMMRSKDTVNEFLKAAASRQLTSIEENSSELRPPSAEGATAAAMDSSYPSSVSDTKPPLPPRRRGGGSASSKATTPTSASSTAVRNYPDLNFLENDVGLWDAFFLHSKNSSKFQSVLRQQPAATAAVPPPPPEYSRQQQPAQSPSGSSSSGKRNSIPVLDSESLRALLPPSAHKHLVQEELLQDRSSPIAQVCQSLSKLSSKNDLHNEAIKSMFGQQQQENKETESSGEPVKVVKVKEAWAEVPEKEQVVLRRSRKEKDEKNMNLINNNSSGSQQQRKESEAAKRRSFHPQDYLSQVLVQEAEQRPRRKAKRPSDFPKVSR